LRRIISGGLYFPKGSDYIRKPVRDTGGIPKGVNDLGVTKHWIETSGDATKSEISKMTDKQKQGYIKGGER